MSKPRKDGAPARLILELEYAAHTRPWLFGTVSEGENIAWTIYAERYMAPEELQEFCKRASLLFK
jgi:hypothetical protein